MTIAAVVITHNRPSLLQEVLNALKTQSHAADYIIVIDNGSGEETVNILKNTCGIKVVRLDTNIGCSGGMARGILEGLALNADWIWLMDDDAIPQADALHHLAAHINIAPDVGVLSSTVTEFGDTALMHHRYFDPKTLREPVVPRKMYKQDAIKVDTASFVGFMLSAKAAKSAGLPNADFFIAYDDIEYSLRLGRSGWSIWLIPASVVNHKRSPEGRFRHTPYGLKHYYNLRNRLAVYRHFGHAPRWRYLVPILQHGLLALRTRKMEAFRLWQRAIHDNESLNLAS